MLRNIIMLLQACIGFLIRHVYRKVNLVANRIVLFVADHYVRILWTNPEIFRFRDVLFELKNIYIYYFQYMISFSRVYGLCYAK